MIETFVRAAATHKRSQSKASKLCVLSRFTRGLVPTIEVRRAGGDVNLLKRRRDRAFAEL